MHWELDFITEDDFKEHVENTIRKYGSKLEPYDLKKFNSNTIDPIKMIFDKIVYQSTWDEIVASEISRQRDKSNNNDIGYFHQRIFQYMSNCTVPDNGKDGGWDVILRNENGIELPDGDVVHTIYVEMKNKHNTMNSASAAKTYIKMQNQLLSDDDCACFLVEAIAKRSQDIKWETTVDGNRVSHKRIRRVSIDNFYYIVTGDDNAFYKMCIALPEVIKEVVANSEQVRTPDDTVIEGLRNISSALDFEDEELSMCMAMYFLGFRSYIGFEEKLEELKAHPISKEMAYRDYCKFFI